MSVGGQLVFTFCAALALICAVLTVTVKTPLRAAVALLTHIGALAAIYLTLHAHLLAAIQLLVYAGAVVVLFIFVIMLIGPSSAPDSKKPRSLYTRTIGAGLMGFVALTIALGVASVDTAYVDVDQCADGVAECGQFGGVDALGEAIFQGAAVPFELVSILLLIAIIGAVAVARGHSPEEKKALAERSEGREAAASTAK